jgi:hypothetical protein
MVWEFIFLMLILKIPVIYLCLVVYWAIRGEKGPAEGAPLLAVTDIEPRPPWSPNPRRPRVKGPHGSPRKTHVRAGRVSASRA